MYNVNEEKQANIQSKINRIIISGQGIYEAFSNYLNSLREAYCGSHGSSHLINQINIQFISLCTLFRYSTYKCEHNTHVSI